MTNYKQNDQVVNTQFNIGRDQIIHNLVLVGQFLDFTKIEDLIPKSSTTNDFNNVADAFENIFSKGVDSNFAQAAAFAGEILNDVITKWTPTQPFQVLPIQTILQEAPSLILRKLVILNYWDAYSEHFQTYLPLPSLSLLWKKNFNDKKFFAISCTNDKKYGCLIYKTNNESAWEDDENTLDSEGEVTYQMFKVVMAGLVIDLMRIYYKGTDDVKFWNNIVETISTKSK